MANAPHIPEPQSTAFASNPGEYRLAIRVLKGEVDPGEEIELEIYITGYGRIRGAKLLFFPPPYFIDSRASKVIMDFKVDADGTPRFGATEQTFEEAGINQQGVVQIFFGGASGTTWGTWDFYSSFFDADPNATDRNRHVAIIATETRSGKAPIEMLLRTTSKAPSGDHSLRFYLTYFNGIQWKTDNQAVNIAVRNFFRRHEGWTWTVGITAAFIGFLSFLLNVIRFLLE